MNRFLRGAFAGAAATAPMTLAMHILHRWPFPERDRLPPEQITGRLAARVGVARKLDKTRFRALTLANHICFGAAAGGAYALGLGRLKLPPMVKGILWGLTVWAVSYCGWIPAAGILPPAQRQSRRRNALMIAAHLVWGSVTALILESSEAES